MLKKVQVKENIKTRIHYDHKRNIERSRSVMKWKETVEKEIFTTQFNGCSPSCKPKTENLLKIVITNNK